ncbi:MAG: hypothetical protein MZV64_10630 [Ignavibacteriales bacterium]|nr:hypothetical protein [Ignavibacteriales bacterium]
MREELLDPARLHRGRLRSPGPAPPARAAEHGELEQPRGVRRVHRVRGRDPRGLPGPDRAAPALPAVPHPGDRSGVGAGRPGRRALRQGRLSPLRKWKR